MAEVETEGIAKGNRAGERAGGGYGTSEQSVGERPNGLERRQRGGDRVGDGHVDDWERKGEG